MAKDRVPALARMNFSSSCVVLPPALRVPALALPSSHVFEGMRAVLLHGAVQWGEMGWAIGLNLIWMAAAMVVFARQFRAARVRGALISIGE